MAESKNPFPSAMKIIICSDRDETLIRTLERLPISDYAIWLADEKEAARVRSMLELANFTVGGDRLKLAWPKSDFVPDKPRATIVLAFDYQEDVLKVANGGQTVLIASEKDRDQVQKLWKSLRETKDKAEEPKWYVYYGDYKHIDCGDPLYKPTLLGKSRTLQEAQELSLKRVTMVLGTGAADIERDIDFNGDFDAQERAVYSLVKELEVFNDQRVPLVKTDERVYFATKLPEG